MFERIKILKKAASHLWEYFAPSYKNLLRTVGLVTTTVVVPSLSVAAVAFFLKQSSEEKDDDDDNSLDLKLVIGSAASLAFINGLQQGLSLMLSTSVTQALREKNLESLLNTKSKVLMYGDLSNIKSLQYVTVGVGVRDYALNAVQIFTALPMYFASSLNIMVQVNSHTDATTTWMVLGVASTSVLGMSLFAKGYSRVTAQNQEYENELVKSVVDIQSHKSSILLMGDTKEELENLLRTVKEIDSNIPKLSLYQFSYFAFVGMSWAVASQFLGGVYTNDKIEGLNSTEQTILNIMLMSLLTNVQWMTWVLNNNYAYVKLNLEQLLKFEKASQECLHINETYNKVIYQYEGEKLLLHSVNIYKPNADPLSSPIVKVFEALNLEIPSGRICKLLGSSGKGKTTFLKTLVNNWLYSEGIITFPAFAKDSICFIPQNPFIPGCGTLMEILAYRLSSFAGPARDEVNLSLNNVEENEETPLLRAPHQSVYMRALRLLKESQLLPDKVKAEEVDRPNIKWSERLSGGEKQKIAMIQALLTDASLVIMDEATAALDTESKHIMYNIIKRELSLKPSFLVLYTDHGQDELGYFPDCSLRIVGQNIINNDDVIK